VLLYIVRHAMCFDAQKVHASKLSHGCLGLLWNSRSTSAVRIPRPTWQHAFQMCTLSLREELINMRPGTWCCIHQ